MAKYRERWNDKARAGSVAKREQQKLKRNKELRPSTDDEEKNPDGSKRGLEQPESKSEAKKRKRVDKYIDLKVRHQERDEIFAKLAASKINTSGMQSLGRLGQTADLKRDFKSDSENSDDEQNEAPTSSFIDNRRAPGGFGFQNLKQVPAAPKQPQKKVTWRERLAAPSDTEEEEEEESDEGDSDSDSEESEDQAAQEASGESDQESEQEDSKSESAKEQESNDEASAADEDTGKSKGAAFSAWAHSLDKHESLPTPVIKDYKHVSRPVEFEPIQDFSKGHVERETNYHVQVERSDAIKESRLKLPAAASEQQIMEAIYHHDVVVLTGATGSGKTTQVPQFLYEAGYGHPDSPTPGLIGITQPRRVAAISMANRVSQELGDHEKYVGYQIRFDAKVTSETRMKFMTDGLLLRELASDFMLEKYSVIIVDEAHERSVNTDILIGMLSRVVRLRREQNNPLKFIIMSATLRVSDFTENDTLFSTAPPVVSLESRQYPVSVHFNRRTPHNYVEEAISKAKKIHEKLPKGGILIFLTGQNEIMHAVKELRKYGTGSGKYVEDSNLPSVRLTPNDAVMEDENVELDFDEEELGNDDSELDDDDDQEEEGFEEEYDGEETKVKVLPLYSLLPTKEQLKVFEEVPKDTRLIVVATNVAETSLTIPGIRYVVDSGRAKQREYNEKTGVVKFRVSWVSKAAADQRAGRAGRSGPGHCYRIFSSAVYERDFDLFSKPEIMRMPIEGLVLQMKSMGIDRIINFPFPTPPPRSSLQEGVKLLEYLGALTTSAGNESQLTDLGRQMALYPLSPRLAKMLLIGNQFECLPFVVAIVASLAVGDPFMQAFEVGILPTKRDEDDNEDGPTVKEKEKSAKLKQQFNTAMGRFAALEPRSDVFKLLAAAAGYGYAGSRSEYCRDNFLREKVMLETDKLRHQIAHLIATTTRPDAIVTVTNSLSGKLPIPSKQQIAALKQIVSSGYIDKIAVRADFVDDVKISKRTNITQMPYITLFPSAEKYCHIHPDSVLAHLGSQPPEFIIYYALTQGDDENSKVRLRCLVDISAAAISNIAGSSPLVTYSKPMGGAYAPKMLSAVKREAWVIPRMGASIGSGGVGWDLPPRKVTQVKKSGEWTIVQA